MRDTSDEYFPTYDDAGNPLGVVTRGQVHTQGLWHCSAHVLLFNTDDELLLQRRGEHKDLYPNCWDYSVGEHLKVGESYQQGARRGLQEELGLEGVTLVSVSGVEKATWSGANFIDRSMFQGFTARAKRALDVANDEVAEVKWIGLSELTKLLIQREELFTPWSLPHLANAQSVLEKLSQFEAVAEESL
jgi:isopentenyl-diphosphate delta-isomerase